MAQYLKDDVQQAISQAALEVFARKGFRNAGMAEIAQAARVSTGNIYRYFENKTALYQDAVPAHFVATFQRLVRQRVEAARGLEELGRPTPAAPSRVSCEELLVFCLQHRQRVVVLLSSCEGTEHEGFAEGLVHALVRSALARFGARAPERVLSAPQHFALEELYRNYVASLGRILRQYTAEADIRAGVDALARYHLKGLEGFFA